MNLLFDSLGVLACVAFTIWGSVRFWRTERKLEALIAVTFMMLALFVMAVLRLMECGSP